MEKTTGFVDYKNKAQRRGVVLSPKVERLSNKAGMQV